jgi:uncharacterized protein
MTRRWTTSPHGYLTALSICSEDVPEREWIDALFAEEPHYASDAQRTEIEATLVALKAHIARQLASDEEFELPCDLDLGDEPDDSELRGWCIGFMEGVFLREEAWFETAEDEVSEMLLPIMVGSGLFDEQPEFADIASNANLMDDMIVQIPEALTALFLLCTPTKTGAQATPPLINLCATCCWPSAGSASRWGCWGFSCRSAHHPFLLLAAACFARSSPRFHHWLVDHPKLGPWIRDYLRRQRHPLKGKVYAIGLMWASIGLSCYLVPLFWARTFMLTSAVLVPVYPQAENPAQAKVTIFCRQISLSPNQHLLYPN